MPGKKEVCIRGETGNILMSVEALGREGDRVVIYGKMLAAWPCKGYIDGEDILKIIMWVLFRPIVFLPLFPFVLERKIRGWFIKRRRH